MNRPDPALIQILGELSSGAVSVEAAADLIAASQRDTSAIANVEGATVDLGRADRCGFGEVIYGEGKSTELIQRIAQAQLDAGQSCLVTRIDPTAAAQVRRNFAFIHHNPLARTLRIGLTSESLKPPKLDAGQPHVAVVTAGSTDHCIAEEAVETLAWMNVPYSRFEDIGVAGPQRLLGVVGEIRRASAVVVIAGMEGALPAAVAGHVASMVIAVPTSSGYGAHFNGLTPLMGMLTSCAANVAVVNIDAGFKGGFLAGIIASGLAAAKTPVTQ
ncbi:nickel pincer cofactor biosynthesis protein LarB [Neorhodopirellula pilleata]|uniref:AIR carboxylase n=1 Tax=Neorhodopirellula pilleata TaxID=2714738 RepID=A0A5C5ZTQ4_9BACT|nr:nickel pincer cofactor biosynthesis protein LarB [Neorhodopirellula pilleata]TWT89533.1 AIR carboxylase [Neorhodopirellula pilleata]